MKGDAKMGKASRDKGYRGEHNLESLLNDNGIKAVRVPLSGATQFQKGDLIIEGKYICEVKLRKDAYAKLYEWLEGNDFLFYKSDRKEALAIMPISMFIKLFKGELGKKEG